MRKILVLLVVVLLTLFLGASSVQAGDDHGDEEGTTSSSSTIPEEGIGLDQGIFVSGATVTPLDGGESATMDEYHAATFMQAWIGAAFFSNPTDAVQDPPPDLPVFRVDFEGTWQNNPGNITAYYATDGTKAWIGFPGLVVWTDPSQIPPPSNWFTPPERTIDAFNGDAELQETTGMYLATSIPTTPEEAAADPGGGSTEETDFPWLWVVVGAVVALGLAGAFALRRRAGQPPAASH